MRDEEGRLLRTYKDGRAHLNAYLEDHAFLLEALLTLYEATFEQRWFDEARALAETMIERFGDSERGGFFSTSSDHEELIARRKEIGDHPIPSGNSAAALGLLRLAALTGERDYERRAEGVLRLFARPAAGHPEAFAHLLRALDFHLAPTREVALVGEDLAAPGGGRARRAAPPSRRRRRRRGHLLPTPARRPPHGRRPPDRLRLRELHLPGPGHGPTSARRTSLTLGERLTSLRERAGSSRSRTASPGRGTRPIPDA